jgi:allophanate hydrolase subunit 2
MRSYLAIRGGIETELVLGSRSYDELSRIGTPPLATGQELAIDHEAQATPAVARQVTSGANVAPSVTLQIHKGPRWGFCKNSADLLDFEYIVTSSLNRIGIRLSGKPIHWNTTERLPSEGVLTGSIQIAADGQPLIFGPDHPTTGGYPVIAVVDERALGTVAQLAPGTSVRFTQSHR